MGLLKTTGVTPTKNLPRILSKGFSKIFRISVIQNTCSQMFVIKCQSVQRERGREREGRREREGGRGREGERGTEGEGGRERDRESERGREGGRARETERDRTGY